MRTMYTIVLSKTVVGSNATKGIPHPNTPDQFPGHKARTRGVHTTLWSPQCTTAHLSARHSAPGLAACALTWCAGHSCTNTRGGRPRVDGGGRGLEQGLAPLRAGRRLK